MDWQGCSDVSTCPFLKIYFKNLLYLFLVINVCQVGSDYVPKGYLRWSTTQFYEGNGFISDIFIKIWPPPLH